MNLAPYLLNLIALAAIFSILAMALDFAAGGAGLVNLGHIAIAGIGAYVSVLLVMRLHVPFLVALLAAIVASALVGFLLSLPARTVRGDYYALLTLAFAFIFTSVALNLKGITRGALGIPGIPRPGFLHDPFLYTIFLVLVAALVYAFFERTSNSPFGRVQGAIRDDEVAAAALGKSVRRVKMITLTISCGVAGLGGALLAHHVQFIDPSSFWIPDLLLVLSIMIVGGVANRKGSVVGVIILFLIFEPLRFLGLPAEFVGVVRQTSYALVLLLIIILRPRGILGTIDL